MAALRASLYAAVCLSAGIITAADGETPPKPENVKWVSLDFKTILTWTATPSTHTFTVLYSWDKYDWIDIPECIELTEPHCDLTDSLALFDRTYVADIKTLPTDVDYDEGDPEHTYSPPFNPFKQSNISAVKFTINTVDENSVMVNITDPITSIHRQQKQLSIRDILKKDLKYKISYYKSGSTGKRDNISDFSEAIISNLDAGQTYCFMVAAYIPSRPKASQLGAWSPHVCTQTAPGTVPELSVGAWVGVFFILITILIIIITVTILCCKCCKQRRQSLYMSQTSAPI